MQGPVQGGSSLTTYYDIKNNNFLTFFILVSYYILKLNR